MYTRMCAYTHMHTCMHKYTCTQAHCMHTHIHVHMHTCTIHTSTHVSTHIHSVWFLMSQDWLWVVPHIPLHMHILDRKHLKSRELSGC